MKKTIKTYGVRGLMEWICQIPVGKAHTRVEFSGGTLTPFGITPAKYTTSDPLKQQIIERSDYFKEGKITLLRSLDTGKDDEEVVSGTERRAVEAHPVSNGEKTKLVTVEVNGLSDAKEYLTKHAGVAAGELKTRKAILDAAGKHGIMFKGI